MRLNTGLKCFANIEWPKQAFVWAGFHFRTINLFALDPSSSQSLLLASCQLLYHPHLPPSESSLCHAHYPVTFLFCQEDSKLKLSWSFQLQSLDLQTQRKSGLVPKPRLDLGYDVSPGWVKKLSQSLGTQGGGRQPISWLLVDERGWRDRRGRGRGVTGWVTDERAAWWFSTLQSCCSSHQPWPLGFTQVCNHYFGLSVGWLGDRAGVGGCDGLIFVGQFEPWGAH